MASALSDLLRTSNAGEWLSWASSPPLETMTSRPDNAVPTRTHKPIAIVPRIRRILIVILPPTPDSGLPTRDSRLVTTTRGALRSLHSSALHPSRPARHREL